jgi:hypothetical protein
MNNNATMNILIPFIKSCDWIWDKGELINKILGEFRLTKDRSIYYNDNFAIRFCYSANWTFSNTVLSLSNLKKYDNIPFIVCLVTKKTNILYIANSTFLVKISHSSQELRDNNIKWSFNWSDIIKEFGGYKNAPENFDFLFASHIEISFEENLIRLVESTNNIAPTWKKFEVTSTQEIFDAPQRAIDFCKSKSFKELKWFLDNQVEKYKNEILIAWFIENVNIRWRIIEYLIAWEDETLRSELIEALHQKHKNIPRVKTQNDIGDYVAIFDKYKTATDIKTKIMILQSNPKAYNIDKLLDFLSSDESIFLFYFIGIEPSKIVNQSLVSIFQKDLLNSTIIQSHWAWRNSRWVAQFNGEVLHKLIINQSNEIDIEDSKRFLENLISL